MILPIEYIWYDHGVYVVIDKRDHPMKFRFYNNEFKLFTVESRHL